MNEENKLDDLNFEALSSEEEIVKEEKSNKKNSKNFITIFLFTFIIFFTSILVVSYYLFLNGKKEDNDEFKASFDLPVVKTTQNSLDFSLIIERNSSEVSIYQSEPRKNLKYLGEGIITSNGKVLTSNSVVNDVKSEILVIKQKDAFYQINLIEKVDSNLVFLDIREANLSEKTNFVEREVKVGDSVFIKSYIFENKITESTQEEITLINKANLSGSFKDMSKFFTDFSLIGGGYSVYNEKGELVGLVGGTDTRNKVTIIPAKYINQIINSNKNSKNESNKDKLGVSFEFSDLAKFKKESRPVGLIVSSVKEDSISEISGIKKDDIVLTINNQVIVSQEELDKFFMNLIEDQEIKFEIVREDKKIGITLSLQ